MAVHSNSLSERADSVSESPSKPFGHEPYANIDACSRTLRMVSPLLIITRTMISSIMKMAIGKKYIGMMKTGRLPKPADGHIETEGIMKLCSTTNSVGTSSFGASSVGADA